MKSDPSIRSFLLHGSADSRWPAIQEAVDGYPGIYRDVLTYLRERIKEVLTGSHASLVLRVFGPELSVLREQAKRLAGSISAINGASNVHVEQVGLVPTVEVRVRPDAALSYGVTTGDVRSAAATYVAGTTVGQIYDEQKGFRRDGGSGGRALHARTL